MPDSETYDPWQHVGRHPDVLVAFDQLEHAQAYWEPEERVILIDSRLGQVARRCALAHELAHVDLGDEGCGTGPDAERLERRQERQADSLAAHRLITLDDLAEALVWALDYHEVAEYLHVDRTTVRTRIQALTPTERDYIEQRIERRNGAA